MGMLDTLNLALDSFRLDAKCVKASKHRHFGLFDLQLGPKCRISKIRSLSGELALKIRSKGSPIIRSIPEDGLVRLQVVLSDPEIIHFESLYETKSKTKMLLPFLFGETEDGRLLWNDMAANPHMLVAGSTGSGKSVFLHNLIANAARTKDLILMLSDPKGVEFSPYRNSRLSEFIPIIAINYDQTLQMLSNLLIEMEDRYSMLMRLGVQSIEQMKSPFSSIMVIIDEVADLILMDGRTRKFEELLVKLAQKCRAVGIYLVIATQRPSVDVLTGLIKANFEARLSCKVSARVDSHVILDHSGAEFLMGCGDAIFKNRSFNSVRLQVAFVTPEETVNYYLRNCQV